MIKAENNSGRNSEKSPRRDARGGIVPKKILTLLDDVGDACRKAVLAKNPKYKCHSEDWIFSKWHSKRHKIIFAIGVSYEIISPKSRNWRLTICLEPNEKYTLYLADRTDQKSMLIATKSGLWSQNLAVGISQLVQTELIRFHKRGTQTKPDAES